MRQSQLFSTTTKTDPKGAEAISHKLLVRGGFIDQLASGVWSYLPLGFRVFSKIESIIREEMNAIGAQEIFMPTLHPKHLWVETGRFERFEPPLFTVRDVHDKELLLAPTHEEVVTDLARRLIHSYKQLPLAVYQIQTKFRNELRATGGLLRVREFAMKDLYSFHPDYADLDVYYERVAASYVQIFERCGLKTVRVEASSGNMGGKKSNEFMALCPVGEDRVLVSDRCSAAFNIEVDPAKHPLYAKYKDSFREVRGIEIGHIFQLGETYSQTMKAVYTDHAGKKKPMVMGCYGIGVGRLLATIVEANHDHQGIIWPEHVSPFSVHLLILTHDLEKKKKADQLYQEFLARKVDVLYDDRDEKVGVKLKDADLFGITRRLIIGDRTGDLIEYKKRNAKEVRMLSKEEIFRMLTV